MTHDINVTRDGRWWMIEIPDLNGLTQARRLGEVEQMAREYLAVAKDVPLSTVEIGTTHVHVGDADVTEIQQQIQARRETAREAEAQAAALMRVTAAQLAAAEAPVRDIGTVLVVSYQRADQLIKS